MKTVLIKGHSNHDLDALLYVPVERLPAPGVLFLHGWGGSQDRFRSAATRLAEIGFICLTLDLAGHGKTESLRPGVTPEQNLEDAVAAYDKLHREPGIDTRFTCVVGFSYGGFLAVLLSELRPIEWLALRSPALYRDSDLKEPKHLIERAGLMEFRHSVVTETENRALEAASKFEGSVLLIESEHDALIPPRQIQNFADAFHSVESIRRLMIPGADHGLSQQAWRDTAAQMLVDWLTDRRNVSAGDRHQVSSLGRK